MALNLHSKKLIFILGGLLLSCSSDDSDDSGSSNTIANYESASDVITSLTGDVKSSYDAAPETYTFTRDNASTVSYTGQTFRQVLIEDLKTYIETLEQGTYQGSSDDALASLNSYVSYSYDNSSVASGAINGSSSFSVTAKDTSETSIAIAEGTTYAVIQDPGSNLLGKFAGNDNEELPRDSFLGWTTLEFNGQDLSSLDIDSSGDGKVEPEDLLGAWLRIIADQAVDGQAFTVANGDQPAQSVTAAYLTESGLDLRQLVQKFIHGAVSFSQATDDYLSVTRGDEKGILADNSGPAKADVVYTAREHHWDEAFGYFGAARDFLSYTDDQTKNKLSIDTDNSGSIALLSEKNFGISVNAAKRDSGSTTGLDLSSTIMNSFVKGRHLIAEKPEGYETAVTALATMIRIDWEKVLAATVIHYINDTISEMDQYGSSEYLFTDHAKFWSEMKGFALGLQFSPEKILSDEQFTQLHTLFGDAPVLGSAGSDALATYKTSLLEARALLQSAYAFDASDVENW
ncbi:DUF4856 domain-containing protein [Pseudobacteriovorax antillogorgiicola]|uniref:DUF4856 domain-containing protein n=1 Tax=Pseudobacteriovorax antillogorgiicola TaxID=1513793 RepID=A0A1Y6BNN3_9BACT|nr:DUF4856 domain-containing protein [Pseudobacteriovorax antillogorgiicola]TCS55458.1 uncharacterized protein DUF4856 [Pseudobacteriovorax antillogorgiicola]SMF12211.1 protein of unknown function [Pseudobacteriovorax antillogorgiicola]